MFADFTVASVGAALAATVGALAGLYQRVTTGLGCWAETSLLDGLQAVLSMIIGRVEHPSPATTLLWKEQGPSEGLAYRCADGQYLQLWFGAKGDPAGQFATALSRHSAEVPKRRSGGPGRHGDGCRS